MDDETPAADDALETKLANLGKAVTAFFPHFSNLRKVRDRLLGDVSDAAFDALVSRLRLYETRNRAEAIRTAIDRTGLPPSAVHEMFNKQESVDTLVASALEHIAENTNRPEEPRDTDVTSDDEWFDVFRREASDRSAGEMREAFVRVLAGEVQQPGSFSVQTLRVLGAISTTTAARFRRAASVSISQELLEDARIPAVGGSLGNNSLSDIGLSFDVLTELTENGLMHPDYACWKQYGPLHEFNPGKYFLPNAQFPFQHQGKRWVLIGNTDGLKRKALRVSGAAFAHAGRELLSVVDIEPMPKFTERLKAHFAKSGYQMIQVAVSSGSELVGQNGTIA